MWAKLRVSLTSLLSMPEMDMVERIIREATAKSKDGRIDQTDFLNHAASSSRYSLFTPMEASIIFHFAGRGLSSQRLALVEFAQLLDPKWRPPHEAFAEQKAPAVSIGTKFLMSAYGFVQGGACRSCALTGYLGNIAIDSRICRSCRSDDCVSHRYGQGRYFSIVGLFSILREQTLRFRLGKFSYSQ